VITRLLETMLALPNVSSGMSLFLKGSVHKIMYKIQTALDIALNSDPQERVMASRRRVVALGVLSDALWHCGETWYVMKGEKLLGRAGSQFRGSRH